MKIKMNPTVESSPPAHYVTHVLNSLLYYTIDRTKLLMYKTDMSKKEENALTLYKNCVSLQNQNTE